MKKIATLAAVLLFSLITRAQTKGTILVYAYQQAVLKGNVPGRVLTEDGKEVPVENTPSYRYFVYTASSKGVAPVEVWIKGKAYGASLINVSTPVVDENPTSIKKNILVPKTTKKVQQWNLKEMTVAKSTSKGRSLSKGNELVVIYKVSGRSYYQVLRSLREIDPVAMQ